MGPKMKMSSKNFRLTEEGLDAGYTSIWATLQACLIA